MSVVPIGADPHHYAVTGKQMKFIAAADLYFSIQLPFEMQIRDRLLHSSEATIVDLVASDGDEKNEALHEHDDAHGSGEAEDDDHLEHHHGHDHGDHDPHVWTDPVQVLEQAGVILAKLVELDSPHAEVFQENAAKLTDELTVLNKKLKPTSSSLLRIICLFTTRPGGISANATDCIKFRLNGKVKP